jgi:predicted transcriptional regulator
MVKKKPSLKLFLRTKPARILAILRKGPKYATILSKQVDCTYSHTVKLLDAFKKFGLVEFEKKGRIKIIKLTSIGEDIARRMERLLVKLGKLKEKKEK